MKERLQPLQVSKTVSFEASLTQSVECCVSVTEMAGEEADRFVKGAFVADAAFLPEIRKA